MKREPQPYVLRLFVGAEVSEVLPDVRDSMAACYCELYNARGRHEWGESWTRESALERIHEALDVDGESRIPILHLMMDERDPSVVAGFLFGAILRDSAALSGYGFPDPEAEEIDPARLLALEQQLQRDCRFPVCSLPEFGIRRPYRGGYRPLADLICPLIGRARRMGCSQTLAWSSGAKKSNALLRAFGGRSVELGGRKQLASIRNHIATVLLLQRVSAALGPSYMRAVLALRRIPGIRD